MTTNEARDLWLSLGRAEATYPTAEQTLGFFRACTDEDGLALAERLIEASERAARCWEHGHEEELRFWKALNVRGTTAGRDKRATDGGMRDYFDAQAAELAAELDGTA